MQNFELQISMQKWQQMNDEYVQEREVSDPDVASPPFGPA